MKIKSFRALLFLSLFCLPNQMQAQEILFPLDCKITYLEKKGSLLLHKGTHNASLENELDVIDYSLETSFRHDIKISFFKTDILSSMRQDGKNIQIEEEGMSDITIDDLLMNLYDTPDKPSITNNHIFFNVSVNTNDIETKYTPILNNRPLKLADEVSTLTINCIPAD